MRKVFLVPILKDNYVFIPTHLESRECVIIDPGQAAPVESFIIKHQLRPRAILLTHHHWDHIGGAQELRKSFDIEISAPQKEQRLIDFADHYCQEGEILSLAGFHFAVLDLPGHTLGHIGFWEKSQAWLFSGDVLFSLGCGRVFDGTLPEHYQSLQKIKSLPANTLIHCTHEYTELNLGFCLKKSAHDPELQAFAARVQSLREQDQPTVPFLLEQELHLNPFLNTPHLGAFTALREERDHF